MVEVGDAKVAVKDVRERRRRGACMWLCCSCAGEQEEL